MVTYEYYNRRLSEESEEALDESLGEQRVLAAIVPDAERGARARNQTWELATRGAHPRAGYDRPVERAQRSS